MDFYIDKLNQQRVSYKQLLLDLRECRTYNIVSKESSYYSLFLNLILSLVLDEQLVLVDEDMSEFEVQQLDKCTLVERELTVVELQKVANIFNLETLYSEIIKEKKNWKITLFTSGTSGAPKRISHSLSSITRSIKRNDRHKSDIWGFAYSPTHMAGVQVFFQAFMNRNTIVRLFKYTPIAILNEVRDEQITHLSATPTFYRLLLQSDIICPSVIRLTSGGEKFDTKTIKSLMHIFPQAKITNVYASTEAGAVFASSGDCFAIKEELQTLVKIDQGELFLHRTLMGESENLILIDSEWYATGDLVEIVQEYPLIIRFLSRKNEMINVGGYKVNPGEVEEEILKVGGVVDAIVFSKKNSVLGNIVCAEVIKSNEFVTESLIRENLQQNLQEFKIPRIIKFVSQFEQTRTGKTKRK